MMRFLLPLLLALGTLAPSNAQAQALPSNTLDAIVAVVDEGVILRSELDRAVANVRRQYAGNPEQLPPAASLERQVLERLILMRLQTERATSVGIRIGDVELDSALQAIAQQNGVDPVGMRARIEADGLSFTSFRESLREEMLVQRLRSRVMQSRISISETEIDILLARGTLQAKQVRIANLLVGLPDGATPEQIDLGRQKVEGIRKLIAEGMDFGAAAIRYSDAANALEGGELGWRSLDEVPPAFAPIIRDMQPGDISEPLRGPSGFQLLKVLDAREGDSQRVVEEVQLRDILVRVTELVDETRARERIDALRRRAVEGGEDFAELARANSENTASASLGGDMGWMPPDSLPPEFARVVADLADGAISQPIRSAQGWHLMQRLASRTQDRTEELLREEARQIIARRKADEEYERFVRQLRDEAYVDSRLSAS